MRRTGRFLAVLLAATPGPALAQDWRAAAPALALDGPAQALRGAVAIGGSAWGPWRRLCREQRDSAARPPRRDCLAVAGARAEGEAMRLTLVQDRTGLRMTVRRDTEGRVTEFAAQRADGTPAPADAARDGLLAAWRAQFETLSLTRRLIVPGEEFRLPVEGSPQGGRCRAEGLGAIRGRQVLAARCAVELAGALRGSGAEARVAIFARVAVDVASGMIVAQGYATRIETFAGGRSNGVVVTPSRVVLE